MDLGRAAEPDMSTYPGMDVTQTLGPLFWGTLVSMMLTGITIIQAYHYFPSKDRSAVQLIALSMLLLDLLSSALAAQSLSYYLLPHFGSTIPIGRLVPALAVECVATTFIIVISQLYFAWQVYALGQTKFLKYVVSGAVVFLGLLAFIGGLGCSVAMFLHASNILTTRDRVFNAMAGVAKVPAALADIIATSSLCYSLGYARTGIRACVAYVPWLFDFVHHLSSFFFQHGLGPQDSDRIRDPTRCFSGVDTDCFSGHFLCVIFAPVLVCQTYEGSPDNRCDDADKTGSGSTLM